MKKFNKSNNPKKFNLQKRERKEKKRGGEAVVPCFDGRIQQNYDKIMTGM